MINTRKPVYNDIIDIFLVWDCKVSIGEVLLFSYSNSSRLILQTAKRLIDRSHIKGRGGGWCSSCTHGEANANMPEFGTSKRFPLYFKSVDQKSIDGHPQAIFLQFLVQPLQAENFLRIAECRNRITLQEDRGTYDLIGRTHS